MNDFKSKLSVGDIVKFPVERSAFGGDVLGHIEDGRVVFVRGAAPGDVVTARLTNVRKKYVKGHLLEVDAGAQRVTPFCGVFAACGGCPWQAISVPEQRGELEAHLKRLFGELSSGDETFSPIQGFETQHWRSTARLHFDGGLVGFRGFGSHTMVDIESCPVFTPVLDRMLTHLRNVFSRIPAKGVAKITADPKAKSGTVSLECEARPRIQGSALAAAILADESVHGVSVRCDSRHWVQGHPSNDLGPAKIEHHAHAFVQAHQSGNQALVESVLQTLQHAQNLLELYAGSGNFTLPLLAQGKRVTTVELDEKAVESLRVSAEKRGLNQQLTVRCGRAEASVKGDFDALLVDPPRSGMPNIALVAEERSIKCLVYVSCNPASLARDVKSLTNAGWSLTSIEPYDLFPHTGHVEVIAVLKRES